MVVGTGSSNPPRVAEETQEYPEGSLQLPNCPTGAVRGWEDAEVLV